MKVVGVGEEKSKEEKRKKKNATQRKLSDQHQKYLPLAAKKEEREIEISFRSWWRIK